MIDYKFKRLVTHWHFDIHAFTQHWCERNFKGEFKVEKHHTGVFVYGTNEDDIQYLDEFAEMRLQETERYRAWHAHRNQWIAEYCRSRSPKNWSMELKQEAAQTFKRECNDYQMWFARPK